MGIHMSGINGTLEMEVGGGKQAAGAVHGTSFLTIAQKTRPKDATNHGAMWTQPIAMNITNLKSLYTSQAASIRAGICTTHILPVEGSHQRRRRRKRRQKK